MKLALALLVVTGGVATAEPVKLANTKAVLDVPATWTAVASPSLVAAYKSPSGLVLAVTRAQVPNPDAWRPKTREAYADQIERGALAGGGKRTARKLGDANGVPALDLEVRRPDGSTVVLRILLFRTYVLAVAIDVPQGQALDEARAVTTKLAPPRS